MGHTKVRCKQPAAEEGGNNGFEDVGFGNVSGGGGGGGFDLQNNGVGQDSTAAAGSWDTGATAGIW